MSLALGRIAELKRKLSDTECWEQAKRECGIIDARKTDSATLSRALARAQQIKGEQ